MPLPHATMTCRTPPCCTHRLRAGPEQQRGSTARGGGYRRCSAESAKGLVQGLHTGSGRAARAQTWLKPLGHQFAFGRPFQMLQARLPEEVQVLTFFGCRLRVGRTFWGLYVLLTSF